MSSSSPPRPSRHPTVNKRVCCQRPAAPPASELGLEQSCLAVKTEAPAAPLSPVSASVQTTRASASSPRRPLCCTGTAPAPPPAVLHPFQASLHLFWRRCKQETHKGWNMHFLCVLVLLAHLVTGEAQLVVNVKTQGGEVFKETITANISDDSVMLEFPQNDGTYISQLIDFKQELQIFKVIVLGEEELGQHQFQVMCFIMRFFKNNFISSDAMSKLRQKNPGTVRVPEEDRGTEEVELDVSVDVPRAGILSPHIPVMCSMAATSTYASDRDIKLWATQRRELDGDWSLVSDVTRHLPTRGVPRCGDGGRDLASACACHYQVCIAWYPCGLKYCKGRDNSGKAVSYRCGIRTCRRCRNFSYFVPQRQLCLWDD